MEKSTALEPGDRVKVTFETSVICVLDDGTVLVRGVGIAIDPENITRIEETKDNDLFEGT